MRKIKFVVFSLIILLILDPHFQNVNAQASNPYDVVAAVNNFRAANGLPPLQIDPILMSIAQAHSDYQASIKTVTHTGAGGSSSVDRAYAAGFGGGAKVNLSENIAGGRNMSIETALYDFWQDALHLSTMLNPAAVYIGAGVGKSDDMVYYTLDIGYYAGAAAPTVDSGILVVTPGSETDPQPTKSGYNQFVLSTPREDGAVVHLVGYGQTLIGIANTYDVPVNDLLVNNNLTLESVIYVGDKIIIKPGISPTPTVPPTETVSPTPTLKVYKPSPTPRASFTPRPTLTLSPTVTPELISNQRDNLVLGVVLTALAIFVAVIVFGFFQGKQK